MWSLLRPVLSWLLPVGVIGDVSACEHERRLLIVANLPSRFAGLLLGLYLPRHPLVVLPPGGSRGALERVLLRLVDHVVLDMNNPAALKRLLRLLKEARPVVVFPEGRVNDGQSVMKVYPVAALAAINSGATIVPIAISTPLVGLSGSFARRSVQSLTLRALSPVRIDIEYSSRARLRREQATRELTRIMQQLRVCEFGRKPVFECFLDAIARYGRSREMIEDQDEQVRTYGEVLKGSLAIARWIRRYTVRGENVGMLLPNVIPSVCTVLGLSAAGRVPAVLNFTAGAIAVKSAVAAADIRTIITSSKFIAQGELEWLVESLDGYRILYLEDIRSELEWFDKLWLMAFATWFPRKAITRCAMSDPCVVLFTSGSEDRPKGVVLSHDAIVSNVAQMRSVFDFSSQDKIFNPLPIFHAYSFTAGMMLSLITGTPMFLYVSPLKYRAIPELVYRHDCTVLFGTSTFLSYYAQNAQPVDFRKLRYVIAGGERLSHEVAAIWQQKFGLRIYEGYGATEAGPVISLSTNENFHLGRAGRLLPGVAYQLQHVEGIDRGGVLHIRAPNLMLGYYRDTRPGVIESPRSALGAGWYDTGDVVEVDAAGLVKIVGRTRRFAKIAGEMVSLDVMEQVAVAASPEHQHAAIALISENDGETTVLFTTDETLTRSRLLESARSRGAHELAIPRKLVTLPEIPVLSTGKTDYVSLKSLAEDDTYGRLLSAAAGRSVNLPQRENTDVQAQKAGQSPGSTP